MTVYCDTSFFLRQLVPGNERAKAMQTADELDRRLGFVPIASFPRFEVIQALRFGAWRNRNDRVPSASLIPVNCSEFLLRRTSPPAGFSVRSSVQLHSAFDFATFYSRTDIRTENHAPKISLTDRVGVFGPELAASWADLARN